MHRNRAHRAFDTVGVHLDATIVEETHEAVPVVEAVTDRCGNGALVRYRHEPVLEPRPQCFDERLCLGLSDRAAFLRAAAADPAFDGIECRDPFQCLVGDRRRTALVNFEKVAPPMQPPKSERHWAYITPRISQLLVDRVAVALNDAGIPREQSNRVLATSAGRIG